MTALRHVVCATDFSDASVAAFDHAVHLARRFEAALDVFHVLSSADFDLTTSLAAGLRSKDIKRAMREAADEGMTTFLRSVPHQDVRVRSTIAAGRTVAGEILAYADHVRADVLVLGTRGRGALGRLLVGSVAREVMHHAPCDVVTVSARPPGPPEPRPVRRILVPIDFSEHTDALADRAGVLADAYDAVIELLHVVRPLPFAVSYSPINLDDGSQELHRQITERLTGLANTIRRRSIRQVAVTTSVLDGSPPREICRRAMEADLVLIGDRGHGAAERLFLGSTTDAVVNRSGVPVYVLKCEARLPSETEDGVHAHADGRVPGRRAVTSARRSRSGLKQES